MIGNIGYERRLQALERQAREIGYGVPTPETDWTPALVQGVSVASTPSYARYRIIGKVCKAWMRVSSTGAGTAGQIIYVSGLPTPATGVSAVVVGTVQAYAGANHSIGGAFFDGSGRVYGIVDGSNDGIGANPAITLAVGTVYSFVVEYEID